MKHIINFGLPIFFFLLPWQTRWIFATETIHGTVVEYGLLSLYAVQIFLLLAVIFSGRPSYDKHSALPRKFVLVLLGIVGITTITSIHPPVSLTQFMHLLFAMLLFSALLDQRVSMRRVMIGFLLGLVLPAMLGVVQFFTGESHASTLLGLAERDALRAGEAVIQTGEGVRWLRAYGSFPHPNIFGGYLAVGLATVFGLWGHVRSAGDKWLLLIGALIFSSALLLTFSRSAWLGLTLAVIVGAMVLLIKNVKAARAAVIPVALLFIAGAYVLSFGMGLGIRPASDAAFEQRSVDERIAQYEDYATVVDGKWLLGHSIGAYPFAYAEGFPQKEWWAYQPIHNVFLLVIAEIGLIGAIAVLAWSSSIDKINFSRFPNRDAVTAFMMGNIVLVILFFDHYLWSSWAGLALVAYVMAMTVRLGEGDR